MKLDLPYLCIKHNKQSRAYAFYRRDGRWHPIRSPDGTHLLPGQPGFLDAYAALHAVRGGQAPVAAPPATDRSINALVASYLASDAYAEKAPETRKQYRTVSAAIAARIGSKLASAIEMPHVLALRDAFGGRATPRKANKAVAILSILMEHARSQGWRRDNPCLRPKKLKTGPGIPTWAPEEFVTFVGHPDVPEPLKRAAALAYYTGLRVSDLVRVPRSARKGGAIEVTTGKTGAVAYIPEDPRLTAVLDAAPPSISPTLLTRADGNPWGLSHIQHEMTDAVRGAGLRPGLSFHGLRKGLTAALAEAEATDAEIEAVIPHADPAMTRYYRKAASQKKLAASAMHKLGGGKGA